MIPAWRGDGVDWRDQGILLSTRRHGESAAIIEVFTPTQGRHAGVVRGGGGRRLAPVLQPGAQLDLHWRARLEDHLGVFTVEPLRSRAAQAMAERRALAGLGAVLALVRLALPERQPHPALYDRTEALLDGLEARDLWPLAYLQWEMALLADLGFALDLSCCAVTGATEGLAFVSPRSGRAVSRAGAGGWADRLLPLPRCMLGQGNGAEAEVAEALGTTGHFLRVHVAEAMGRDTLPEARARFVDLLARSSA